jgi:hypothetical protein
MEVATPSFFHHIRKNAMTTHYRPRLSVGTRRDSTIFFSACPTHSGPQPSCPNKHRHWKSFHGPSPSFPSCCFRFFAFFNTDKNVKEWSRQLWTTEPPELFVAGGPPNGWKRGCALATFCYFSSSEVAAELSANVCNCLQTSAKRCRDGGGFGVWQR